MLKATDVLLLMMNTRAAYLFQSSWLVCLVGNWWWYRGICDARPLWCL